MATELYLLGATLILALVQILVTGHFRTRQYGTQWNAGPRDETMPPLDVMPARLQRAQDNLFETLPLFIGALLGAAYAGRLGFLTNLGAYLFFFGRLVYVPLYAAGIRYVRSLAWLVATGGLILVIAGLFRG